MTETARQPRVVPADAGGLAAAVALLRAGQPVAVPTETVYGLGANALDPAAVARIYEAKGRPAYNPIIVHVADVAAARVLARPWPAVADRLAARWWPGPLTIVVPRAPAVPDIVTAGMPTVALRVPAHPAARALLMAAGMPLAAPSANRSGEVSPTEASHVARSLAGRIPLVLDGGATTVGIESTVVDLSGPQPVLLRPGAVSRQALEEVLGTVAWPARAGSEESSRPAPGMLDRHYAPRAPLRLLGPGELPAPVPAGERLGALLLGEAAAGAAHVVVRLPADPAGYARGLFRALHQLDDHGVTAIVVTLPPDTPAWAAIRDRLGRAAHP